MGNSPPSSPSGRHGQDAVGGGKTTRLNGGDFPGSAFVDSMIHQCGALDDATDDNINGQDQQNQNQQHNRGGRRRSGYRGGSSHTRNLNDPVSNFLARTDELCNMSPTESVVKGGFGVGVGGSRGSGAAGGAPGGTGTDHLWKTGSDFDDEYEEFGVTPRNNAPAKAVDPNHDANNRAKKHEGATVDNEHTAASSSSALFAKALVSEVTDNPKTMTPKAMAEREFKLLKAQEKARQAKKAGAAAGNVRPIGSPSEGVGKPNVLGSLAHALGANHSTGSVDHDAKTPGSVQNPSIIPPNSLSENRATVAQAASSGNPSSGTSVPTGQYTVSIGLSLSRRSALGHPDTVTRQTAFDFNELQDREYKYVSSTDASGWRAGGGERGGGPNSTAGGVPFIHTTELHHQHNQSSNPATPINHAQDSQKIGAPDTVHIPIIHIDAGSQQNVDAIISALARGEVFIPHMAVIPESLSVNGVSPPDLVVRFGTERNEDLPPDEWPNWCIEFMHNQLYEYFHGMGARWMKRPFSITLARKVRWKTVKHMNKYFAHAERVIDAWREKGPQYLDPQLAYIEGGATPEEVAHPHGIYLLRNGVPTNYFAPNFDPPYTTKMTRSLLLNVLGKSWDRRRREWSSEPIPKILTPSMLVTAIFGCAESQAGGFVATEATTRHSYAENSDGVAETILPAESNIRTYEEDSLVIATQNEKRHQSENQQDMHYITEHHHQESSYNNPICIDGGKSANGSPTGHDLRTLSSASGVPAPTYQPPMPQNDYDEDRMMAMADVHYQQPSDNMSGPMTVKTNLNMHVTVDDESTYASKSAISNTSLTSSKVRQKPTPEKMLSPLQASSTLTNQQVMEDLENSLREQRILDLNDQENANPAKKMIRLTPNRADPPSLRVPSSSKGEEKMKNFVQQSVATKNTTVDKSMQQEPERGEGLSCDEDWLDEMDESQVSSHYPSHLLDDNKQTYLAKLQRAKLTLERERQRPSEGREPPEGNGRVDPDKKRRADAASPSLRKNYSGTSGVSLEYSIDSAGNTIGESTVGSSLLGQHIDTATVASNGTKDTRGRHETNIENVIREATPSAEESNGSTFLSSHESDEPPSDEDLFRVGWAKTLDPKSGSYYYFTLDRSKIVWENPLAPPSDCADDSTMGELEYEESEVDVPQGVSTAVIR